MKCRHCGTPLVHTFLDLGFAPEDVQLISWRGVAHSRLFAEDRLGDWALARRKAWARGVGGEGSGREDMARAGAARRGGGHPPLSADPGDP